MQSVDSLKITIYIMQSHGNLQVSLDLGIYVLRSPPVTGEIGNVICNVGRRWGAYDNSGRVVPGGGLGFRVKSQVFKGEYIAIYSQTWTCFGLKILVYEYHIR